MSSSSEYLTDISKIHLMWCLVLWKICRTFTKCRIWQHILHCSNQWLEIRWIDNSEWNLLSQNFKLKGNSLLIFLYLPFEIHIQKCFFRFLLTKWHYQVVLRPCLASFLYSLSLMGMWCYFCAIIYYFQMFCGFIFCYILPSYFCAFSRV